VDKASSYWSGQMHWSLYATKIWDRPGRGGRAMACTLAARCSAAVGKKA